jgi:hypothetical protein
MRKIAGHADFGAAFAWPLSRADQIRSQQQRQRGWKLYSFHAPEVECIGKGKASGPRPQCRKAAPRLHLRPKARGLRPHQTRAQTSLRHRGGDRTNESKAISAAAISKVAPAMPPTFILSAVGYNLRLVLAWLRMIFARHPLALLQTSRFGSTNWIFNGRRTRTASFSCPLWPRQANDDS